MKKSKYFRLEELVDPVTFATYGQSAWRFIDARLIDVIDRIREELDTPITVNDWYWGGNRKWSCLRNPKSEWYRPYSQHSFGRAIDMLPKGMTAEEARQRIIKLFKQGKLHVPGLRIENKVSWVHIDLANVVGLVTFNA